VDEQLPFQHLMEVLLDGPAPGVARRLLLGAQVLIQIDVMALRQQLDDHFGVADQLAVQLDPRVLLLGPLARVVLDHLFVGDPRQFEPRQQLDGEGANRGQAPVGAEGEDAEVMAHLILS
jgi:hypothetical protein